MQRRSQNPSFCRLLHENDSTQTTLMLTINFQLNILSEAFAFLQSPDLSEARYDCNVGQVPTLVFTSLHLRLGLIEGQHQINLCLVIA